MAQSGIDPKKRQNLLALAQNALKDERHWSVVGCEDRSENADALAQAVLDFFGTSEAPCPKSCEFCQEHRKQVGDEDE